MGRSLKKFLEQLVIILNIQNKRKKFNCSIILPENLRTNEKNLQLCWDFIIIRRKTHYSEIFKTIVGVKKNHIPIHKNCNYFEVTEKSKKKFNYSDVLPEILE